MADVTPHCSVDYHKFNGADLETKGHAVSTGIYGNNPPFTAPPLTQAAFDALVEEVHTTYEAYKNGGAAQKGAYLTARANLIKAMDDTGDYVDGITGVNADMIILAGYTPTKTGESSAVVPDAPVIDKIERNSTKTLEPFCKAVSGAEYYGCIILEEPWSEALYFGNGTIGISSGGGPAVTVRMIVTKSRGKLVTDLEKGKEYWIYFYCANSAGVSQLSAGQSVICD